MKMVKETKVIFQDELADELQRVINELDEVEAKYEALQKLFFEMSARLRAYNLEEIDEFLNAFTTKGETLH
jgi:hypothetical protein|tara:strand:+ start:82 stop:294 length:213 start_codon:yes stop_codon:yes gene_type:complete